MKIINPDPLSWGFVHELAHRYAKAKRLGEKARKLGD